MLAQRAEPLAPSYQPSKQQEEELRQQIAQLEKQVQTLQKRLNDLHCTDLNALKRAHTTLVQHIQALNIDSLHLTGLIRQLETTFVTPAFVAQEVGIAASAVASVWVLDRGLRIMRVPLSGMFTQAVLATALGALSWRLIRTGSAHVMNIIKRNRSTKQQLQQDWEAVRRRVEIMVQLTAVTAPP